MTAPVMFGVLDAASRRSLAHALMLEQAWMRRNGADLPPQLVGLLDALLGPDADTGQAQAIDGARRKAIRDTAEPAGPRSSHVDGAAVVTFREAARRLAVHPSTARRMAARGDLDAVGAGAGRRVTVRSITDYVEGGRRGDR
ncbi:helix-turn-helix domain-containing protein [Actinoplanes sp. Pm04-4]|uniref:Helix-turn-helix domain-containing protein n=1 Tax=Paractinoplanes pyxinae TaxID=2997416 RepID=A0ABT4B5D7_9ACTN|nr:helix-turn-helix domain-containing protein [Actinoplanes pyxinae]MCY1141709.1 helix-turn-helix domain-containing protein [Actinoplanes pyxinae]